MKDRTKKFEVCADCEDDDAHYQVVSTHSSANAATRAMRKFENETGRDAWIEPDGEDEQELL